MFSFFFLFLLFLFNFQSTHASMARLEDYPTDDSAVFKKKDRTVFNFFKDNSCVLGNYPISLDNHPDKIIVRACSMNFASLKNKKKELLNYIKNPINWSQKNIHQSLYNKYHLFHKERRFYISENNLIIYVLQDALLVSILNAAKNNDCRPLNPSDVQEDKIPKGFLLNKACSIRVQDDRLKPGKVLSSFYNPQDIDRLFKKREKFNSFKNYFISNLDMNFESFKTIVYASGFNSNTKKLDSNKNLSAATKGRNHQKTDRKPSRLKNRTADSQDALSDSAGFEIHIIELTREKKEAIQSTILQSLEKNCFLLEEKKVDPSKIPQDHFLHSNKGCFIKVQDHRLKKNGSLHDYYNPQAIDSLFKDENDPFNKNRLSFKHLFIKKLKNISKKPKNLSLNILNSHIYSQFDRNSNKNLSSNDNSGDNSDDASDGSFQIHIIQTQKIQDEILKQALNPIDIKDSASVQNHGPLLNQVFYNGVQIQVKHSKMKNFNLERLNFILKDWKFKNKLFQKINIHKNFPPYSLLYIENLSEISFDIFIVQTQRIKKLQGGDPLILKKVQDDLIYQVPFKECQKISSQSLKSLEDINIPKDFFILNACQIILNNKEFQRNGRLDDTKIQQILYENSFRQKLIEKINLINSSSQFQSDDILLTFHLNKPDRFLIVTSYTQKNKTDIIQTLKKMILDKIASALNLENSKKRWIERSNPKMNPDYFIKKASMISLQDPLLAKNEGLAPFLNSGFLDTLFDDLEFKNSIINQLKNLHGYSKDDIQFFNHIKNQESGAFEIYFYQTEDKAKTIMDDILPTISSYTFFPNKQFVEMEYGLSKENLYVNTILAFNYLSSHYKEDGYLVNTQELTHKIILKNYKNKFIDLLNKKLVDVSLNPLPKDDNIVLKTYINPKNESLQILIFNKTKSYIEAIKTNILAYFAFSSNNSFISINEEDVESNINENETFKKGIQIQIYDFRLKSNGGTLKDYFNENLLKQIFLDKKNIDFKKKILQVLNKKSLLTGSSKFSFNSNDDNLDNIKFYVTDKKDRLAWGQYSLFIYEVDPLGRKKHTLEDILIESVNFSSILNEDEKKAIEINLPLNKDSNTNNDILLQDGFKISVKDDRFKPNGWLVDFYEVSKIDEVLKNKDFFNKLISKIKAKHSFNKNLSEYFIQMRRHEDGTFNIFFYNTQNKKDSVEDILIESVNFSSKLNEDEKKAIEINLPLNKDSNTDNDILLQDGFKLSVKDDRFKPNGRLVDFYEVSKIDEVLKNKDFFNKLVSKIKAKHSFNKNLSEYFIQMRRHEDGPFNIFFHNTQNKKDSVEDILIESVNFSSILNEDEKKAIEINLPLNKDSNTDNDILLQDGFKLSVKDDRFKPNGRLVDFYEVSKIDEVLKNKDFFNKLISKIKAKHSFNKNLSEYFIQMRRHEDGTFNIFFYNTQNKKDSVEDILIESVNFSSKLNEDEKKAIEINLPLNKDSNTDNDILLQDGFKISVKDDRFKPNGRLVDFYEVSKIDEILKNKDFFNKLISKIKAKHSFNKNLSEYFIQMRRHEDGPFNIFFHNTQNKKDSVEDILIESVNFSSILNEDEKKAIEINLPLNKDSNTDNDILLQDGFKLSVKDDRFKPNGRLVDFYEVSKIDEVLKNKDFFNKLISKIKAKHSFNKNLSEYFIQMLRYEDGSFNISFYNTQNENSFIVLLEKSFADMERSVRFFPNKQLIEMEYGLPKENKYLNKVFSMFIYNFKNPENSTIQNTQDLFNRILEKKKIYKTKFINFLNKKLIDKSFNPLSDDDATSLKAYIDIDSNILKFFIFNKTKSYLESIKTNILSYAAFTSYSLSVINEEDVKDHINENESFKKGTKLFVDDYRFGSDRGTLKNYFDENIMNQIFLNKEFKKRFLQVLNTRSDSTALPFNSNDDNLDNIKIYIKEKKEREYAPYGKYGRLPILIYEVNPFKNKKDTVENIISETAKNCKPLYHSDIQKLQKTANILDKEFIGSGCQIIIQNKLFKKDYGLDEFYNVNKIKEIFNSDFKQKIINILKNELLDKDLELFVELGDPNKGEIRIYFLHTKTKKTQNAKKILQNLANSKYIGMYAKTSIRKHFFKKLGIKNNKYINYLYFVKRKLPILVENEVLENSMDLINELVNNDNEYLYDKNPISIKQRFLNKFNGSQKKFDFDLINPSQTFLASRIIKKSLYLFVFDITDDKLKSFESSILNYLIFVLDEFKRVSEKDLAGVIEKNKKFKHGLSIKIKDYIFDPKINLVKELKNINYLKKNLFEKNDFKEKIIKLANKGYSELKLKQRFLKKNLNNIKIQTKKFKKREMTLFIYEVK